MEAKTFFNFFYFCFITSLTGGCIFTKSELVVTNNSGHTIDSVVVNIQTRVSFGVKFYNIPNKKSVSKIIQTDSLSGGHDIMAIPTFYIKDTVFQGDMSFSDLGGYLFKRGEIILSPKMKSKWKSTF